MQPYWTDKKGRVSLYHGDCRDVMSALPDTAYQMILTDPPYGIDWASKQGTRMVRVTNDHEHDISIVETSMAQAARILQPGCPGLYFCSDSKSLIMAKWIMMMHRFLPVDEVVTWVKPGFGFGSRYRRCKEAIIVGYRTGIPPRWFGGRSQGNVICAKKVMPCRENGFHPTPKPVALMEQLIKLHTETDDIVVDPFAGSGSTLLAAIRTGRLSLGIEVEERWCDVIAHRLEKECHRMETDPKN
jgi:site-specific DNA-methyltransferase (adenine-specific)